MLPDLVRSQLQLVQFDVGLNFEIRRIPDLGRHTWIFHGTNEFSFFGSAIGAGYAMDCRGLGNFQSPGMGDRRPRRDCGVSRIGERHAETAAP